MARIRIELPEQFAFTTVIAVRITDLNYGGHVGNDSVLSLIHEARVQFLRHYGYSELDLGGVGLIMSDVAIEFKNEIFYGDTLRASVAVGEFTRTGFELFYKLEKETSAASRSDAPIANSAAIPATAASLKPVAFARTGMVCYHYALRKIAAVPEEVIRKLGI